MRTILLSVFLIWRLFSVHLLNCLSILALFLIAPKGLLQAELVQVFNRNQKYLQFLSRPGSKHNNKLFQTFLENLCYYSTICIRIILSNQPKCKCIRLTIHRLTIKCLGHGLIRIKLLHAAIGLTDHQPIRI